MMRGETLLAGKRMLVIVADPSVLRILKRFLTAKGADVCGATSVEEGLRQYQTRRPDLIVTDLVLPDQSAKEFCDRTQCWATMTPVICLSVLGKECVVETGEYGQEMRYVTKPFHPMALLSSIQEILAQTSLATAIPGPLPAVCN